MPPTAPIRWSRSRAGSPATPPVTPIWRGAGSLTGGHCSPRPSISSALVSGLKTEPALDILAGWLASRIDGPVERAVGELKVELVRPSETITLQRPQDGVTATLTRTDRPEAKVPLARRETRDCLAEDLRRLDADEIYHDALQGLDKVKYK